METVLQLMAQDQGCHLVVLLAQNHLDAYPYTEIVLDDLMNSDQMHSSRYPIGEAWLQHQKGTGNSQPEKY